MRLFSVLVVLLLAPACPKAPGGGDPVYSGPSRAFRLLSETPEAETSSRPEKRADLFVTTTTGEPVPAVVATGQAGPVTRQGGRVRLFGDEAGKQGWAVDNFVLLEVTDPRGTVLHRAVIGFQQGCALGAEQIDSLGPMKFSFAAGEIDISALLPARDPFIVKATALDIGGVGRVSDLFMILSPELGALSQDEELREK